MARSVPPGDSQASPSAHASGSGTNGLGRMGSGSSSLDQEDGNGSSSKRKRPGYSVSAAFRRQSEEHKMRIIKRLNESRERVDDDTANIKNLSFGDIADRVEDQEIIFREETGGIDANTILSITAMTMVKARQFRSDTTAFDVDGFLIKIKEILGLGSRPGADEDEEEEEEEDAEEIDELGEDDDNEVADVRRRKRQRRAAAGGSVLGDWSRIGWMANKRSRRAPGLEFMLGPMAVEYQKRTINSRAKKAALAPVQRPEEIIQEKSTKVDDTITHVKKVGKRLERLDPESRGIPYFPFFINPRSFGQSVENNFFVSFLVRDGRAGFHLDEHNQLIITHRDPTEEDEVQDGQVAQGASQAVIEFDHETWQEAIEVYGLDGKDPLIPHREPKKRGPMGANQWYS